MALLLNFSNISTGDVGADRGSVCDVSSDCDCDGDAERRSARRHLLLRRSSTRTRAHRSAFTVSRHSAFGICGRLSPPSHPERTHTPPKDSSACLRTFILFFGGNRNGKDKGNAIEINKKVGRRAKKVSDFIN